MNDHDGLGTVCDLCSEQVRIEIPGIRLAIDHYRDRPGAYYRCRAGNDSEARQDHLVSSTDPQSCERHFNGDATIAYGNTMRASHQFGEPNFEALDKRAFGRNPARVDALIQVFLLIAVEHRAIDRDHIDYSKFSFGGNSAAN